MTEQVKKWAKEPNKGNIGKPIVCSHCKREFPARSESQYGNFVSGLRTFCGRKCQVDAHRNWSMR